MQKLFFILILLSITITPAFAAISDRTGLVERMNIEVIGHSFEVVLTSNFGMEDYSFDKEKKQLSINVNSSLENNLGELVIPKELLAGDLTFLIDDVPIEQKSKFNGRISFVTLEFEGLGPHKIDVIGTEALEGVIEIVDDSKVMPAQENGGGCLIATAAFDSELAPQVQKLREIRDSKLLYTESGTGFMASFNSFYYSFSPIIADYERENPVFKEAVKIGITPMLSTLSLMDYAETETEVLGIGISLIILNAMMYVGLPVFGIMFAKKRF